MKNNDKFTAAWMDRCHELELEIVKLKNKPKVTREFVEKWRDYFDGGEAYDEIMKHDLIKMLKEAGVEVEKK